VIRHTEALPFQLMSLSVGVVSGAPANLGTFVQTSTGGLLAPITLEEIASNLDKNQQEAELNKAGRHVVCYGSLYVGSQQRNVVAFR
jgi:hypothetical protein